MRFGSACPGAKKNSALAQKVPLTHQVYDHWKEITYKALTNDGNFAAFTINPQDGDGKVIFYDLKNQGQDSVKRADNISLTFDSRLAIFKIKPPSKLVKDLRRQKKKKEDLPKDSLGIYSFLTHKTEKIPEVKSFRIPEKSGEWLAYQLEAKKPAKPKTEDKTDKTKPEDKKSEKTKKKSKPNNDDHGYTLVLRKLQNNKEVQFGFVKDFIFSKYGQSLLFASSGNDSTLKAGVYRFDLTSEKLQPLYEGRSKYKFKGLALSEDGSQASFLVDTDTTKAPVHKYELFYWGKNDAMANALELEKTLAITPNWLINENYSPLLFKRRFTKLFLGTSPKPVVQDTTLLPEEIVNVEVWRGEDGLIYPQQNKQVDAEKKRSYLAVIDLGLINQ